MSDFKVGDIVRHNHDVCKNDPSKCYIIRGEVVGRIGAYDVTVRVLEGAQVGQTVKERISELELVASPPSDTPKFKLGEKATGCIAMYLPGPIVATGPITDILISDFDGIKYRISDRWFPESNIMLVPDTVMVEISRDLAEWYAATGAMQLQGNMHLGKPPNTLMREASRKALGI